MVPSFAIGGRHEHLQRRIAGSSTHSRQAGIDSYGTGLSGNNGVCNAKRKVVMCMYAPLSSRQQNSVVGFQALAVTVHVKRTAAICYIDAMHAVILHKFGLLCQRPRLRHMAHHQKTRDVHAQFAGEADMLLGDIRFSAMGGDAYRGATKVKSAVQILHGTYTGQEKRSQPRCLHLLVGRFYPIPCGIGCESVIKGGSTNSVAMGNFNCVDSRIIESLGDASYVIDAILMTDGMHTVAEGDVLNIKSLRGGIEHLRRLLR